MRTVTAKADLTTQGDAHLSTTTYIDPQGRTRETVDVAGNIVQSRYYTPAGGPYSYRLVSNPYVSGSEPSMGWTLATLDRLGRTLSVQHCNQGSGSAPAPVGNVACNSTGTATVSYGTVTTPNNFSTVTSTDEAGVARTDYFDGLGRLVQVTENNGTETTTYAYDALDNLTSVSEPNAGGRTFTYSSLSRLTNASNPENGNTSYTYDANGNLLSRTQGDATHGFKTIGYTYDNLDQLLGKSYSDVATAVTFSYSADWLQSVSVAGGTTWQQQFDGLGRATSSSQATNGTTYTFPEYLYNLADLPTSVTTPTGRVVTISYDSFGRAISVSGVLGDKTKSYVSQLSYAPHGGITQMLLGNGLWESMGYNNQLQQTSVALGTSQGSSNVWGLTNTFSATQNNGNVASQSLTAPGLGTTIGTGYAYDGVNRLQKAMENASNPGASACGSTGSQWCRFYGYDRGGHGNAAVTSYGGGVSAQEPASFNASNQIADANWQYGDGRGNVTTDRSGNTFVYDAENRQVSYCGLGSICTTYTYDGAGRRVIASNANGTTVFVYDAGGNLAAEYATTVQTTVCATCYITTDHLGSTRVVTDDSGCAVFRQDYMPFGMAVLAGTGDPRLNAGGGPNCVAATNGYMAASPARTQFTSKERDAESGLDYFGVRYMSSAQGRFTSVDPVFATASLFNPQSWNGYSYTLNNPLKYIDPDGGFPINVITGAVGALAGAAVGAAGEYVNQLNESGQITSGARIWTAAGGGALAGGIAGFTLGIGAGAGAAAGALETGIVTAESTLIGNFAQHRANDALGLTNPGEAANELGSTLANMATAGVAGAAGGALADRLLPIPNVRKEIQLLRFASRRSTRAARINAASVRGQAVALGNATIGNAGGAGIQQTLFSFWSLLTGSEQTPPQAKPQVTSRICFTDESGNQSCQ